MLSGDACIILKRRHTDIQPPAGTQQPVCVGYTAEREACVNLMSVPSL